MAAANLSAFFTFGAFFSFIFLGSLMMQQVLVSRAEVDAFHAGFWVIFAMAALGALTAAITFPRPTTLDTAPGASQPHVPLTLEPSQEV